MHCIYPFPSALSYARCIRSPISQPTQPDVTNHLPLPTSLAKRSRIQGINLPVFQKISSKNLRKSSTSYINHQFSASQLITPKKDTLSIGSHCLDSISISSKYDNTITNSYVRHNLPIQPISSSIPHLPVIAQSSQMRRNAIKAPPIILTSQSAPSPTSSPYPRNPREATKQKRCAAS